MPRKPIAVVVGADVTIVSHEFPRSNYGPDFASPKAGAHWRTMCDEDDERSKRYDALSYSALKELALNPNSGVHMRKAIDYFDYDHTGRGSQPWWSTVVDNFHTVHDSADFPIGYSYTTPVVTPEIYLWFLLTEFRRLGGRTLCQQVSHVLDAIQWIAMKHRPVTVVINCTGHGARHLGGVNDHRCYQTRGQTILVRAAWVEETITWLSKTGEAMYIIPRANGEVILGGTKESYINDDKPRGTTTTHILSTILKRYPNILPPGSTEKYAKNPDLMSKFDIVDMRVGFRPSRIGGIRIDVEQSRTGYDEPILIAHNYGHGGAGYQASWGCAQEVFEKISAARKEPSWTSTTTTVDADPSSKARL
ncbi:hypothetical protein DFQ26_008015 [Actinomortierella ambigua]|nr:hypothetical protein DFQ26_008015 [Actinomortierella ambigua]